LRSKHGEGSCTASRLLSRQSGVGCRNRAGGWCRFYHVVVVLIGAVIASPFESSSAVRVRTVKVSRHLQHRADQLRL
jgi:hypothetical protein